LYSRAVGMNIPPSVNSGIYAAYSAAFSLIASWITLGLGVDEPAVSPPAEVNGADAVVNGVLMGCLGNALALLPRV
jgi:hypothetical protein